LLHATDNNDTAAKVWVVTPGTIVTGIIITGINVEVSFFKEVGIGNVAYIQNAEACPVIGLEGIVSLNVEIMVNSGRAGSKVANEQWIVQICQVPNIGACIISRAGFV
jgi:hypothetical protein